jgi:hypothetical protein
MWQCTTCEAQFPRKNSDDPKGRCSKCVECDVLRQSLSDLYKLAEWWIGFAVHNAHMRGAESEEANAQRAYEQARAIRNR